MEVGLILSMIIGVSELLKKQGLRLEVIPWINGMVGIFIKLSICEFNVENIGYGFVLGLVAGGIYDHTKICKLFKAKH